MELTWNKCFLSYIIPQNKANEWGFFLCWNNWTITVGCKKKQIFFFVLTMKWSSWRFLIDIEESSMWKWSCGNRKRIIRLQTPDHQLIAYPANNRILIRIMIIKLIQQQILHQLLHRVNDLFRLVPIGLYLFIRLANRILLFVRWSSHDFSMPNFYCFIGIFRFINSTFWPSNTSNSTEFHFFYL